MNKVATANGVYANELQGTTSTGDQTSGITASTTGETGTSQNETAETNKQ